METLEYLELLTTHSLKVLLEIYKKDTCNKNMSKISKFDLDKLPVLTSVKMNSCISTPIITYFK